MSRRVRSDNLTTEDQSKIVQARASLYAETRQHDGPSCNNGKTALPCEGPRLRLEAIEVLDPSKAHTRHLQVLFVCRQESRKGYRLTCSKALETGLQAEV